MQIVEGIVSMQRLAKSWKSGGIGFVPTMGYLHQGHVSLMERARKAVGSEGKVVVSIYVNPTQFGPHEDLAKYPRDLKRDKDLCRAAGVDLLFVPRDDDIYPTAPTFGTYVVEENLSRRMEGLARSTHFRGVTTIVAKLFNLVLPDVAVFGAKDFQQAAVIKQMIRDLNFPVKLVVAPTVRERDGLAMSSRNKYLSSVERQQATVLNEAIRAVKIRLRAGTFSNAEAVGMVSKMVQAQPSARLDYVEYFDPETLKPVKTVKGGVQIALAVFIGRTRLIDNARL